ncbi:MAG: YlxR family protein [Lachnospiraceae bacterium]|nr:YlxR family protein [Lachnospiraceae bacterium]
MRMCLACRKRRPKSELIRINGNAAERGVYVCNDPECTGRLMKSKKTGSQLKEALANLE